MRRPSCQNKKYLSTSVESHTACKKYKSRDKWSKRKFLHILTHSFRGNIPRQTKLNKQPNLTLAAMLLQLTSAQANESNQIIYIVRILI